MNSSDATFGWNGFHNTFSVYYKHPDAMDVYLRLQKYINSIIIQTILNLLPWRFRKAGKILWGGKEDPVRDILSNLPAFQDLNQSGYGVDKRPPPNFKIAVKTYSPSIPRDKGPEFRLFLPYLCSGQDLIKIRVRSYVRNPRTPYFLFFNPKIFFDLI